MTPQLFTAESFSEVVTESIDWLWEPYLPRGKLVVLDGDPGIGKSMLTLDLAARLSCGGLLPDGKPVGRLHATLVLSAEDRPNDTLRPRAEAAGADLSRLFWIRSASGALLRLPADIGALEQLIAERQADLVVIDPVMAFLPREVAAGNDQCVRTLLKALDAVAERTRCTILLVRHLRKKGSAKAVYRGLGSIGLIGGARVGLLAAFLPGDPVERVLTVTKSNLAGLPPAFGFRVRKDEHGRGAVEWTGPVDITADALGGNFARELPPRERAALWLHQTLATGPQPTTKILAEAAQAGIPERTLRRAKSDANIRSHQLTLKNDERVWYWYDLNAPWPKNAPFERPNELSPLEPIDPFY